MNNRILIVGSGICGITAANILSENNEVWLLEKNEEIGGLSFDYSCKATDKCNYCGWCLVKDSINEINKKTNIKVLKNSSIKCVKKNGNSYTININTGKDISAEDFSYIILASGSRPFDARKKVRFGYGHLNRVITGYELEKSLRGHDFSKAKSIAFIQCVGSRDRSLNAEYCSKVCCRYAVRMVNYISFKYPDTEITVYYMDLQLQGRDIEEVYDNVKTKEHISFIRGIPEYIEENNDKVVFRFENTENINPLEKEHDLAVLSVGLSPNPDNALFSKLFGINLDKNGFIITDSSGKTNTERVFAAGTAVSPDSIKNTINNTKAVVETVKSFLKTEAVK
jgi:heterodisulfide reductase subunit A2